MKYLALTVTLSFVACSSSSSSKTSTLEGSVASGFPGQPSMVRATDEAGTIVRARLAADGSFRLTLDKGHSYRLDVVGAGVESVVFPRARGTLDTTFHIGGGGARVLLGQLHHFDVAPPGGFTVVTQTIKTVTSGTPAASACVNGTMQGTGSACADDAPDQMTCEGGDGEAEDDGEPSGEVSDGKCVNGKDSVTGTACSGGQTADPANPMAVPDHNVPTEVGGCDDGEEED